MVQVFWAIARNTVQEIFRKPIYCILLVIGMALIALSPTISMFTMMDDVKLLIDMGLATTFLMGLVLAVLASSTVVSREIGAKTIATVMSKPVGRLTLLAAKHAGLLGALLGAEYLLSIVLLITVRIGVPETASYEQDWPALWGLLLPLAAAILVGLYRNYFDRASFVSSALRAAFPAYTLSLLVLMVIGKGWKIEWLAKSFVKADAIAVAKASLLVFLGVSILVGVALAASTRLNVVSNLGVCATVFFLGMVSYYLFGQFAENNLAARAAWWAVPNLQAYWVSEGFVEKNPIIPWSYIGRAAVYTACYSVALLGFAAFLFEERELV